MTFASLIALAVNHHLKATQRLLTANELGTTKLGEIKGVLTVVITTAFVIEGITFIALFPGLYKINHGNVRHTLWESLFFAVMAYNNAGFTPDGAGLHVNNWAVGLPILASAFCGTLGFPVLLQSHAFLAHAQATQALEPAHQAHPDHHLLHRNRLTHLVPHRGMEQQVAVPRQQCGTPLVACHGGGRHAAKLRLRPVVDATSERCHESVPEHRHVHRRWQYLHRRRIRVTTLAVILLVCRAAFTGRREINAFHRRIHTQAVMTAVSVSTACLTLVTVVSMTLMIITDCSLCDALFDTCSAFGLGGYSVGVADAGNPAALYVLAATMFIGRLGPMTIAYAVSRPRNLEAVRYPTEQIVVG